MEKRIIIDGGKELYGEVSISGAKNAALAIRVSPILNTSLHIFKSPR